MREGKNYQVRRPVRGLFVTLIALSLIVGLSCSKKKKTTQKTPEKQTAEQVAAKKAAQKQAKKPKPPQTGIKVDLDAYMHRINLCDKTYFSHINPNSIDDWQTPIPLGAMQARCDQLTVDLPALVEKYLFYGPGVDDFLFQACNLADHYRLFLARSKNMSVRKKLPWKKEVSVLKKNLREISLLMRKQYKALVLKNAKPKTMDHAYLVLLIQKYLKNAMKNALDKGFSQAKKKKVVYIFTLNFESTLLNKLASQKQPGTKIAKPLSAFALSYKNMVKFFSGNYFDHLDDQGRKLKRDLRKTGSRFNRAIKGVK